MMFKMKSRDNGGRGERSMFRVEGKLSDGNGMYASTVDPGRTSYKRAFGRSTVMDKAITLPEEQGRGKYCSEETIDSWRNHVSSGPCTTAVEVAEQTRDAQEQEVQFGRHDRPAATFISARRDSSCSAAANYATTARSKSSWTATATASARRPTAHLPKPKAAQASAKRPDW